MTAPVDLPPEWVAQVSGYPADGGPSGKDWLRTVPSLITGALERWDLDVAGDPRNGWTAIVVPVRRGGEDLVLKVTWPHPEGLHEHLALRLWDGRHAVRLVAADPRHCALLLERLDADTDLFTLTPEAACAVVGGLLRQLHVPAPDAFLDLTAYLVPHLERMATRPAVPRRIRERTLGLFTDLSGNAPSRALLHTDLHYENVLRGRGKWLAIDPKPLRGHPAFELLPLLWNRHDELEGRPFRIAMRRRLEIATEAAGIDVDLAYAWSRLRSGLEISWASTASDTSELTKFIALSKALED